jgi:hypothetical protein
MPTASPMSVLEGGQGKHESRTSEFADGKGYPLDYPDLHLVEQGITGWRCLNPQGQQLVKESQRQRVRRQALQYLWRAIGVPALVVIAILIVRVFMNNKKVSNALEEESNQRTQAEQILETAFQAVESAFLRIGEKH